MTYVGPRLALPVVVQHSFRALLTLGLCAALIGVADAQTKSKKVTVIRKGGALAKAIQKETDVERRGKLEAMAKRLSKSEKVAFVRWATDYRVKKGGWTKLAKPLATIGTKLAIEELSATARQDGNELGSGRAMQALQTSRSKFAIGELLKGATGNDAVVRRQFKHALRKQFSDEANGTFNERFERLIQLMNLHGSAEPGVHAQADSALTKLAKDMVLKVPDPSLLASLASTGPKSLAVAIATCAPKRLQDKTPRDLPSRLAKRGTRHRDRGNRRPKPESDEEDEEDEEPEEDDEEDEEELTLEEQDEDFWNSTPERSEARRALELEQAEMREAFRALIQREEDRVNMVVIKNLPAVVPTLNDEFADFLMASLDPPASIRMRDAALRSLRQMTGQSTIPRSQLAWKRWWKVNGNHEPTE